MYSIEYTESALDDLKYFRKAERQLILDQIDLQLMYEPTVETTNRKRLRSNELAEWELRIGMFRVFYDVTEDSTEEDQSDNDATEDTAEEGQADDESDEKTGLIQVVKVEAIGQKKGNKLFIRGEEFEL
ncbi:MAG: addiction module toxin RelE [Anaerolineae bacterium]|nr:addiction module toxin RelE [Anaerolineae bacterium]